MADPAPVAQTFFVDEFIQERYVLDGIITVVDAKHLLQHLDEEKPEGVENESEEQLAFADKIILNKCDLVGVNDADASIGGDGECADVDMEAGGNVSAAAAAAKKDLTESEEALKKVEARIKAINNSAEIIRSTYSKVDPQILLNVNGFNLDRVLEMDPEFLKPESTDHEHDDSVSSVSFVLPGLEMNINKLNEWIGTLISELGNDLFRYKGVIAVKGCEEKYVFQGVHMLFAGGFASQMTGSEGAGCWKKDEPRDCRFVFIGKQVKQVHGERLEREFKACAAEDTLRFKLGDTVEARRAGGWSKAKVIKVWDQGNPYRLEVEGPKKVNIWGPIDSNRY